MTPNTVFTPGITVRVDENGDIWVTETDQLPDTFEYAWSA